MLGKHKIILDSFCEISNLLRPYMDSDFYDLTQHEFVPGAVYIISRQQFAQNKQLIIDAVAKRTIRAILCNPVEGSESMHWMYKTFGIENLIDQIQIPIVTGGYVSEDIPHFYLEHFLPLIRDYNENLQAIEEYSQNFKLNKPYKFLFLNGRSRVHRKYLLERFRHSGLLDQSLWSNLDDGITYRVFDLKYEINGQDVMQRPFPIHYLPPEYEVNRYRDSATHIPEPAQVDGPAGPDLYAKRHLFTIPNGYEWGEIYLESRPYLDTYFSLVTETVFDFPYSFRTEKIWKPVAIGHPWIAATNAGFYRDIRNAGFKTFGHLIDESFDSIDNPQDRIERVSAVVENLCRQNLDDFAVAAQDVCKYNQQLQIELGPKIRQEFPNRFEQFLNERFGI